MIRRISTVMITILFAALATAAPASADGSGNTGPVQNILGDIYCC